MERGLAGWKGHIRGREGWRGHTGKRGKGERSWREEKRLERSEHQGLVCKAGQKRRESLCEGNSPGQPVQTALPLI